MDKNFFVEKIMNIPAPLKCAIEEELNRVGKCNIVHGRQELTDRYRNSPKGTQPYITTEAHRCSYLATRLPATHAAITRVLQEIRLRQPDLQIKSMLDLGAGPGTAMWAATEIFPEIHTITLIEKDRELLAAGKRLARHNEHPACATANWINSDLEQTKKLPAHDLVILSYSVGELPEASRLSLLSQCWEASGQLLVIIEPGTPVGFERIRTARSHLISLGAQIVAPCPHANKCPMANDNWCHFFVRLDRSFIHRQIKGGSLGYEDEKFSYVAVSKNDTQPIQSRILRHPIKRSGHMYLTLCTPEGHQETIVSKKTPELYKQAKQLDWGDAIV